MAITSTWSGSLARAATATKPNAVAVVGFADRWCARRDDELLDEAIGDRLFDDHPADEDALLT